MGVCSKCSAPYTDGQQFCTSCGASLNVGAPNMGAPGSAPNSNSFENDVKNLLKSDDLSIVVPTSIAGEKIEKSENISLAESGVIGNKYRLFSGAMDDAYPISFGGPVL